MQVLKYLARVIFEAIVLGVVLAIVLRFMGLV